MSSSRTAPALGNTGVDVDVAAILALHPQILLGGIPEVLHACLCRKLAQKVFDADASFCIQSKRVATDERRGGRGGGGESGRGEHDGGRCSLGTDTQWAGHSVTAKKDLVVDSGENVWLLKHTAEFACADELRDLIRAEDERAESTPHTQETTLRPLRAAAALASGATTTRVTNALLDRCVYLLPSHASSSSTVDGAWPSGDNKAPPTKHGILERLGLAFEHTVLGQTSTCQLVTMFSSTCNAYVAVLWITTPIAVGEACTVPQNNGCYMPFEQGGKAHLHRVASLRYHSLFRLSPDAAKRNDFITDAQTSSNMVNLSPDSRRPIFLWKDFLKPDELSYFRNLVYGADASAFGTQFVRLGQGGEPSTPEETTQPMPVAASTASSGDADGDGALSPEVMAMVAAALTARGTEAGVTKNRLRTSHFLRTVWWTTSPGKQIYSRIARRAALRLGLCSGCAETPQMVGVCGSAGLSAYFCVGPVEATF